MMPVGCSTCQIGGILPTIGVTTLLFLDFACFFVFCFVFIFILFHCWIYLFVGEGGGGEGPFLLL